MDYAIIVLAASILSFPLIMLWMNFADRRFVSQLKKYSELRGEYDKSKVISNAEFRLALLRKERKKNK